jgi:hypothetical protein
MTRHRIPHPFAPPQPGGTPLGELIERHSHLVAVGLANCRAAQALHKEIARRQVEQRNAELDSKAALLSNEDDANNHYNPIEARDKKTGRWTTGGTNSSANPSVAAQVKGSPLKFGFGLNEKLQQLASGISQGMAQISDPGPLKPNFHTFLQAQDRALAMVPNPHFDPLTLEPAPDDTYERAMSQMIEERERARERLRAPWESFSAAAAEEADEFAHLKDITPGPKIVGTAGEKTGEFLGYAAPFAIPGVGEVAGPLAAGLASTGDTFNQAFEAYKQRGLSDEDAREKAREVAINTGVTTGMIFALPIGRLASLPKSAIGQILLRMGINGAQMSADELQSLLQAKATYNPNLTLKDIAKQTGNSFLMGAMLSGVLHGVHKTTPEELASFGSSHGPEIPLSATERAALDMNVRARMPIDMDAITRANIDGHFPLPKGYELDAANNRFIYTGLGDIGTDDGARNNVVPGKKPLRIGEITTYKDFDDRSEIGDDLEGHELWQHSNIKTHDLATYRLSTEASKQNPVMVLDKETHKQVSVAQRSIDASSQTPTENISANTKILPKLGVANDKVAGQFEQMANQHSEKYIKPGTHEPQ